MHLSIVFLLLLGLINVSFCDIFLQIIRNTEENYTPIKNVVNEKAGTNLTLSCELFSDVKNNLIMDDQITWEKASQEISLRTKHDLEQIKKSTKTLYSLMKPSDTNKAVKNFLPLKLEDAGQYFCISFKYMLFKSILINVGNNTNNKQLYNRFISGINFQEDCNENMFQCMLNGACINLHYVCDGRKDCRDGSDENFERCKGDPCKDKLPCEDGRCIPHYWCCDRRHDINCNVTYRPTCCQQLSDPYDDLEYGYVPYNITQVKTGNTRYLFISFCILATFFSVVLMLLIVSKVFIFANKTACTHPRNLFQLEEISLRQTRNECTPFRGNILGGPYRNRLILSNVRYIGDCDDNNESSGVGGNVCHTYLQDQPPSYADVVDNNDPPPPYTSREFLNLLDERSRNN